MGGRGSSGGTGGSVAKLPKAQSPIDLDNLPALTGTQKQINWAISIREQVLGQLAQQMYRTSDGYPTRAPDYVTSEKDMQKFVKSTKEAFKDTSRSVLTEKVNDSISALKTASTQVSNLKNLISKETSAKFWIDHRNTHPADPEWKKLRKKIIGY